MAQKLKIKTTELFVIGEYEDDSDEHLFVSPQQIFTDSFNDFYLRDIVNRRGHISKEIKKYSSGGKFNQTIGTSGQGPCEFLHIVCFCSNDKDELVIYDTMNRRYTIFDPDGKNCRTIKYSSKLFTQPRDIYQLSTNSYLVINSHSSGSVNKLFTIYTDYFSDILETFGDAEILGDIRPPLSHMRLVSGHLNVTVIDSTKIIAAPKYYDGEIFLFEKIENNWEARKLQGKKPKFKSFKQIPISDLKKRKYKKPAVSFGIQGKVYAFLIYNKSIGIFSVENKYVFHFSIQDDKRGKYNFIAEVFSFEGEYLGYGIIKKCTNTPITSTKVIGKDNNDCFFMTEQIDDIPVIKKINFEFFK